MVSILLTLPNDIYKGHGQWLVLGFYECQPASVKLCAGAEDHNHLQSVEQWIPSEIQNGSRVRFYLSQSIVPIINCHFTNSMRLIERALLEHTFCVDVYFLLFCWLLGKPVMDLPLHPKLDYVGLFSTFTVLCPHYLFLANVKGDWHLYCTVAPTKDCLPWSSIDDTGHDQTKCGTVYEDRRHDDQIAHT